MIVIANTLNENGFEWSLGASMMLKLRGIDVTVDDIDLIVKTDEIDRLEKVLRPFNPKKEHESSKYPTSHFYEFSINDIDVDIMIGFKVNTHEGVYTFNNACKVDKIDIDGTIVYLSSLEEWLKAYIAMNRIDKILAIQKYLEN